MCPARSSVKPPGGIQGHRVTYRRKVESSGVHLKALTLRGFKSFASATTLRFEPGITCAVGPTGSGKSNVVEARSRRRHDYGRGVVKLVRGRAGHKVPARRKKGERHLAPPRVPPAAGPRRG